MIGLWCDKHEDEIAWDPTPQYHSYWETTSANRYPFAVRCRYNTVNFLHYPYNSHPIATVTAMPCATSWKIGPRYNGTWLYSYAWAVGGVRIHTLLIEWGYVIDDKHLSFINFQHLLEYTTGFITQFLHIGHVSYPYASSQLHLGWWYGYTTWQRSTVVRGRERNPRIVWINVKCILSVDDVGNIFRLISRYQSVTQVNCHFRSYF